MADIVTSTYGEDVVAQQRAYDDLGSGFFTILAKGIGLKLEACGTKLPVVWGTVSGLSFPSQIIPNKRTNRFLRHGAQPNAPDHRTRLFRPLRRHVRSRRLCLRTPDLERSRRHLHRRSTESTFSSPPPSHHP